jgi:hypothetical protein
MEYPLHSLFALFAFVPDSPKEPDHLPKSIFYFPSRKLARRACMLMRSLLPATLRQCAYAFTAVYSEEYKKTVMERFRTGKIRWLFCTDAAGMGTDVADIVFAIIYGVQAFADAMQKGGRAGRMAALAAVMIWLVQEWAFEPQVVSTASKTKKQLKEEERRAALDPATKEYLSLTQGNRCMRQFAADHFRPQPNLPGFPSYAHKESSEEVADARVEWEVVEQNIELDPGRCCSARVCRKQDAPDQPIGLLTDNDRARIRRHIQTLQGVAHPSLPIPDTPAGSSPLQRPREGHVGDRTTAKAPSKHCSQEERATLQEALQSWRREQYVAERSANPFLSRDWIITEENIGRLVGRERMRRVRIESAVDTPWDAPTAASWDDESQRRCPRTAWYVPSRVFHT